MQTSKSFIPFVTLEKLVLSVDNHKNLATVKGHEELIRKLKDLLTDFDEHEDRLR